LALVSPVERYEFAEQADPKVRARRLCAQRVYTGDLSAVELVGLGYSDPDIQRIYSLAARYELGRARSTSALLRLAA
jgi:hypothetical protein